MRDIAAFHQEVIRAFGNAAAAGNAAAGPEEALAVITDLLPRLLGDKESHLQPGNLKEGEKQQFACGCFVVTPDGKSNLLLAPINFGPTQRHMKIDVNLGHPGWVVQNKKPMLLANTDTHQTFVKILETFRAGSAVFAPVMWGPQLLGQIICASQARNTFCEEDLEVHVAFGHLAAALWMAHCGPEYLNKLAA
jgi:hypothetical protein